MRETTNKTPLVDIVVTANNFGNEAEAQAKNHYTQTEIISLKTFKTLKAQVKDVDQVDLLKEDLGNYKLDVSEYRGKRLSAEEKEDFIENSEDENFINPAEEVTRGSLDALPSL